MFMSIEVKEFKGGRLVHHQMVREDDPDHYLDERFEIFEGRFGLQVTRRPGMLIIKRLVKETAVYWKEVKTNEPVWAMGDKYYHYYPVENGIRWKSETTIYKGIYDEQSIYRTVQKI